MVDVLLICALKSLLLWIIWVKRKKSIKYRIGVQRYAQGYVKLFRPFLHGCICVCTQTFPTLDYLRTQASTLGHGCILCKYANIPAMILTFQRWIICAYEQVPRYIDEFCACTQLFLNQCWIICAYEQVPRDMDVFCVRTQIFLKMI